MKKGDWLFTCSMMPVQFGAFDGEDDFETITGACHSVKNCGLKPISRKYALWFLSNEIHKNYDELKDFKNLSPLKRIDKNHYIKTCGNLEFHYIGSYPLKKDHHSNSYMKRFHNKWLMYKGFRLELTDRYNVWDVYEQYVKQLCEQQNIKFEGV